MILYSYETCKIFIIIDFYAGSRRLVRAGKQRRGSRRLHRAGVSGEAGRAFEQARDGVPGEGRLAWEKLV